MAHSNEQSTGPKSIDVVSGRAAPADRPSRCSSSQTVLILGAFVLIVGGVLVAAAVVRRRTASGADRGDFEAAQEAVARTGRPATTWISSIRGAQPGSVHIEVRDGKSTATTRDGTCRRTSAPGMPGRFPACSKRLNDEFALPRDPKHERPGRAGSRSCGCAASSISKFGYPADVPPLDDGRRPGSYLARQQIRAEVSRVC